MAATFGRGAMTNGWTDIKNTDLVFVMGGNPAENHPCGFKWAIEAKKVRNAKIVVVDPRYTRTAAVADIFAQIRSGTDIAFLSGIMRYAIEKRSGRYSSRCSTGRLQWTVLGAATSRCCAGAGGEARSHPGRASRLTDTARPPADAEPGGLRHGSASPSLHASALPHSREPPPGLQTAGRYRAWPRGRIFTSACPRIVTESGTDFSVRSFLTGAHRLKSVPLP